MDDAESIESVETSLGEYGLPGEVSLKVRFKSGHEENFKFTVPAITPVYAEPVTGETIFNIIATAYSFGEAPYFAIPVDGGAMRFFDLTSTDFLEVEVRYFDE